MARMRFRKKADVVEAVQFTAGHWRSFARRTGLRESNRPFWKPGDWWVKSETRVERMGPEFEATYEPVEPKS